MADEVFDYATFKKTEDEAEAARLAGKPVEAKPEAKPAPGKPAEKPEEHEDHEDGVKLPRSVRRELNGLRARAAAAEERSRTIQEFIDKGMITLPGGAKPKAEEVAADPEPQRKDFATDAEYQRAAGKWDARQEAQKEVKKLEAKTGETEQMTRMRQEANEMEAKAQEDIKTRFTDWEEVKAAAEAAEDAPTADFSKHPTLMGLLAFSPEKAAMLYHWAKNPELFQEFLDLESNQSALIAKFHRLEGKLETVYPAKQTEEKKAKPTAAELDARKAKPSESVSSRNGSPGSAGATEMLLADGKTINPAWKAEQNAKEGLRP